MRYWAYLNGEVPGSFSPEQLAAMPGVTMTTLVCPADGEIDEKNWRRAGECDEVARALAARAQPARLAAPAEAALLTTPSTTSAKDVDAMIDAASTKLFHHVADLMKELENRREEKALILSLQRFNAAVKEELAQARERIGALEMSLARMAELEESQRKDQTVISSLQSSLQNREQSLTETRVTAEKLKNELDTARRRNLEAQNDLAIRNRLVDKLSRDLSEKELSLAKSLGVIRRMEEDLNRLCPEVSVPLAAPRAPAPLPTVAEPPPAAAAPAPTPAPAPEVPTAQEPVAPAPTEATTAPPDQPVGTLSVPEAPSPAPLPVYTADEPPQAPPYLEPAPPTDRPKAQEALVSFLKRLLPGQPH
jgi:hypothetical protein